MPYSHELRNQRRLKRAAVLTAAVVGLFVLLFLAPTRMQGWAGLGWGSLFGPEEELNLEAPSEPPALAQAKVPPGGYLSWPTSLEWTDHVAFGCADCDGWQWPYGFEMTELDHAGLRDLEESAGASLSTPSLMANASNGAGGSSRGLGSAGRSAGGSGGSGGGGGASRRPGETSSDQVGSESGDPSTLGAEPQAAQASAAQEASASGAREASASGSGADEVTRAASSGSAKPSASYASSTSDRPIVDSVVAAGPGEADNLLLSPLNESQDGSVGPLGSNDPSARRDDVLKAVADSPVGAETIYGEGDAAKVADLVGLGPASAESEGGGEQRVDIVPEPASLTLVAIALAGTVYRRRRTASC